jgi:hypothetical protein
MNRYEGQRRIAYLKARDERTRAEAAQRLGERSPSSANYAPLGRARSSAQIVCCRGILSPEHHPLHSLPPVRQLNRSIDIPAHQVPRTRSLRQLEVRLCNVRNPSGCLSTPRTAEHARHRASPDCRVLRAYPQREPGLALSEQTEVRHRVSRPPSVHCQPGARILAACPAATYCR